mgnify:FL=1
MFEVGQRFLAEKTVDNENCFVAFYQELWITHIEGEQVSFYLPRKDGTEIKAFCSKGVFLKNFISDESGLANSYYAEPHAFTKEYPNDFLVHN